MTGLGNVNGWSDEDYQAVMRAAEESFLATAKLRAALPPGPAAKDRYYPTAPRVSQTGAGVVKTWTVAVGKPAKPARVAVDFELESKQLQDTELQRVLARRAGQAIAAEEGRRIYRRIRKHVSPQNVVARPAKRDKDELKRTLNKAITLLHDQNHLGPHLLVMTPALHADYRELLFSSSSNRLFIGDALGGDLRDAGVPSEVSVSQQIEKAFEAAEAALATAQKAASVPGAPPTADAAVTTAQAALQTACTDVLLVGGTGSKAVVSGEGLLISLGAATVELVEVDPLALSIVEYKPNSMTFRLEERVAVRVIDPTGIVQIRNCC